MRVQLRRWLPMAAFVGASCATGFCVLATSPMVFGQEVEAEEGEAPSADPSDERSDFGQASDSDAPPDSDAPSDIDRPTEEVSQAENEPADTSQKPADDDPQAAAPLEETSTDDATQTPPALKPASLDGVRMGSTTREELHELWGKPRRTERIASGARETYHLDKLGSARATIAEDVVAALSVHVEHPLALAVVEERLAIDDVEPVDVLDDQGELLGAAYPPRGVLLGYVPRTKPPRVFQIIIEPINAQAFLARAEARLATRYADCLADVEQALALAPTSGLAHRLRAEVAFRGGDLDAAHSGAQSAIELEPRDLKHRLLLARVLAASGGF